MTADGLTIADGLTLPIEAVTQTFAIVAKRGSGKTYAASVMAEEMLHRRQRLVIVDPTGAWWGLRAAGEHTSAGYPVVILGGEHADVPLDEHAGEAIADLVVDDDLAVILDLSLMRKGAQRRFMTDFAETLYHRNRSAVHLFVDEADLYAPQRVIRGGERLLGAMEDIVRRGRLRGLGCTLITQRPASLHKDVLSQTEVLVALRLTGSHDRKALDEWIRMNADEDQRDAFLTSLAGLAIGEAWVWSPGWLQTMQRVRIRERRTFDSSATPEPGSGVQAPTEYATVDLDALRDKLAETVERAEADDPAALRKRVAVLERELSAAQTAAASASVPPERVGVEVPTLPVGLIDEIATVLGMAQRAHGTVCAAEQHLDSAYEALAAVMSRLDDLATDYADLPAGDIERMASYGRSADVAPVFAVQRPQASWVSESQPDPVPEPAETPDDRDADIKLRAGARRMLAAFANPPGVRRTKPQVGALAGYAYTGGTFGTYWRELVRGGLITEDGDGAVITDAGLDRVDDSDVRSAPRTTDDVLAVWEPQLRRGPRLMLRALIDAHPRAMPKDELADATGYERSGGTFGTYVGELRRLGLVDVNGDGVAAADVLFP